MSTSKLRHPPMSSSSNNTHSLNSDASNSSDLSTMPSLVKSGSLSVFKDFGVCRYRWKACQCRLYSNSLFMCYESLASEPTVSLHLKAVTPYIRRGTDFGNTRIPKKVSKVNQRLLLAIPTRFNSPFDDILWIKFLNIESLEQWLSAIILTIPVDDAHKMGGMSNLDVEYYRSLRPKRRTSQFAVNGMALAPGRRPSSPSDTVKSYQDAGGAGGVNALKAGAALFIGVKAIDELQKGHETQMGRRNRIHASGGHDSLRRSSSLPTHYDDGGDQPPREPIDNQITNQIIGCVVVNQILDSVACDQSETAGGSENLIDMENDVIEQFNDDDAQALESQIERDSEDIVAALDYGEDEPDGQETEINDSTIDDYQE